MNSEKAIKLYEAITEVDAELVAETAGARLRRRRARRPGWAAAAACAALLIGAAWYISTPSAVTPPAPENGYPYNDDAFLDYTGSELGDIDVEGGVIVMNEITEEDIGAYRLFNTVYDTIRGEAISYYETREAVYRMVEQRVDDPEDVICLTLFKKDGSFENCPGYEEYLALSELAPGCARFMERLYDIVGEAPVGCRFIKEPGTAGFHTSPLANCGFYIITGETLDGLDARLDAFLPLLRRELGTENASVIDGQELSVSYFYQTRLCRGAELEETYRYYAYFELDGAEYLCQFSSCWAMPGRTVTAMHDPPTTLSYAVAQETCRGYFAKCLTQTLAALRDI